MPERNGQIKNTDLLLKNYAINYIDIYIVNCIETIFIPIN